MICESSVANGDAALAFDRMKCLSPHTSSRTTGSLRLGAVYWLHLPLFSWNQIGICDNSVSNFIA